MRLRVLVTGFSVFPGAPTNPSARLVQLFEERQPSFGPDMTIETTLLATAYGTVGKTLSAIGESRHPDIGLHFGLAKNAHGFRLEGTARNQVSCTTPDVNGHIPATRAICEGPDSHASSLPLDAITSALSKRGLPTELSNDAGDYLCNFTFYNARSGGFTGYQPRICGFIHIPYLDHQLERVAESGALPRLSEEQLWAGALTIIETCLAEIRPTAAGK